MQVGLNAAKCIRKACTPGTHLLRGPVFQTPRCVPRVSIQCSAGTEHGTAKLPSLASILPGCVPSVLSAALEEYPDLAEVDEEYALMWIRSAGSVLKLREQDVQEALTAHPWLLLADLLAVRSAVAALTRVLSVTEAQAARAALLNPDVLESDPVDLMEQLMYVCSTTGLSYDQLVRLAVDAPGILTAQPRDVVRAWADVRAACGRGNSRAGGGGGAAPEGRESEQEEPEGQGQEEDADAGLEAEVLEALRWRPGLLLLSGEDIRGQLLGGNEVAAQASAAAGTQEVQGDPGLVAVVKPQAAGPQAAGPQAGGPSRQAAAAAAAAAVTPRQRGSPRSLPAEEASDAGTATQPARSARQRKAAAARPRVAEDEAVAAAIEGAGEVAKRPRGRPRKATQAPEDAEGGTGSSAAATALPATRRAAAKARTPQAAGSTDADAAAGGSSGTAAPVAAANDAGGRRGRGRPRKAPAPAASGAHQGTRGGVAAAAPTSGARGGDAAAGEAAAAAGEAAAAAGEAAAAAGPGSAAAAEGLIEGVGPGEGAEAGGRRGRGRGTRRTGAVEAGGGGGP